MSAEPPFVFISYPREVSGVAEALSEFLRTRMVATWTDTEIEGGALWQQRLSERLRDCGALVVLVAPGIDDLTWQKREIGMARRLGRRIFPVLLPGAGENELRTLGLDPIQAERLVDNQPSAGWVGVVHDVLYDLPPPIPTPPRARRRWWPVAAAVLVAGAGLGWWLARPADGRPCAGRPAHIDAVSTVSPGHTGHTPQVTVTVCEPAAPGHVYWLMDYTTGDDGRRFYAKKMLNGSGAYGIVHDQATGDGTSRTYLVLDVPPELAGTVAEQWTLPDAAPLVAPGTDLPAHVTPISNEVPAVL